MKKGGSVCVTGAGGYIGSWLVKNLLQNEYTVHATLRDPENQGKTGHLLLLPGAKERLKLFKADLSEEGSFDSAVQGCYGVFQVPTPLDFDKDPEDDVINPAVKGVVNVLRACTKAGTVKRLVYTSSLSAASPLINDTGEYSDCLDESHWTDLDLIRNKKPPSWVGKEDYYEKMKSVQYILGSIPLVHIEDVCNAHIFLMEQPCVQGRHICSSHSLTICQMADFFCEHYPQFNVPTKFDDNHCVDGNVPISSKKMLGMGFSYDYDLEKIMKDTIEHAFKTRVLQ
eukprot:Gb_26256 [translate_table: standard]